MADYRHILVAEDETNISDFLRRGLEDSGYTVSTAADGNEAWLSIEDMMSEGQLSLLLLDIRMPGMSGLQLCERFRKHYGYNIPVILLTALATTDDIVAGLHAGADDYLCKPFKFAELLADQIDRPMGKPTLVDESDKREPYNSAAADFGGVNANV